ncbi:MAG: hypothetical protein LBS27_01360 [Bifidobacteriaceae bacterium]|jgi:hypothetical protein|nr:hypothetical protein [Bifidobacteriaceae bacterium]
MKRKRLYLIRGLVAAVAATLAVAGCSGGDDVATLGGESKEPVSPESEQAQTAEDFSACLKKADVPHTLQDMDDGQKAVDFSSETEVMAMAMGDGSGSWGMGGAGTEAELDAARDRLSALVAKYDSSMVDMMEGSSGGGVAVTRDSPDAPEEAPRYLIVGETDYTQAFVKCLDQSDYTGPVYKIDPAEELRQKTLVAEASTEWAKCARENGFPNIKDPDPPKADEWATNPSVLLPGDITEQALRDLLAVCPNFDAEKAKALDEAYAALQGDPSVSEEDWAKIDEEFGYVEPSIDFDVPGRNDPNAEMDEATQERMQKLREVLWEEQQAYYQSQMEVTEGLPPTTAVG